MSHNAYNFLVDFIEICNNSHFCLTGGRKFHWGEISPKDLTLYHAFDG